ncbi:MAG: SPOR domain-containing protein [Burkholderiaceae bacterium]|nr:SPOR domain-containing protein [Burkholderiaceae bacterium]
MLRLIVLALVLANAGYYAWSHHLLRDLRIGPTEEAEPQRMAQQIRPDVLRVIRVNVEPPPTPVPAPDPEPAPSPTALVEPALAVPDSVAANAVPVAAGVGVAAGVAAVAAMAVASNPTTVPAVCLQAGTFDAGQADTLRRTLTSQLPAGSWSLESVTLPGRWMVYMGRFNDNETLNKKRNELRARKVSFDRPGVAALEPGLTLGRFATEDAADRALIKLNRQGVRSARVVQERDEITAFVLRLPTVDANLRAQLHTMRRTLVGRTLRPCT